MGLYEFKSQHFCPGVWPSPWKKRPLLGKEPDLLAQQDIHIWSSYMYWGWALGILHPHSPCLLHTEHLCTLPLPWHSLVYRKLTAAGKIVGKMADFPPLHHCLAWEGGGRARLDLIIWVTALLPNIAVVSQEHSYLRPLAPNMPQLTLGAKTEGEQSSIAERYKEGDAWAKKTKNLPAI